MRALADWEVTQKVEFEGKILRGAGGVEHDRKNNLHHKFYVDDVKPGERVNHYRVTWDLTEFYKQEAERKFDWPTPHAVIPVENDRDTESYFSSSQFVAMNKTVEVRGVVLKIINRPVEFAPQQGLLQYYAGAIDAEGNVYHVFGTF